jgi:hypothetical protein
MTLVNLSSEGERPVEVKPLPVDRPAIGYPRGADGLIKWL